MKHLIWFYSLVIFIKVCDDSLSELIPCLDRNLIYQTRLKLDLSLMEHYERHCPIPQRRYNCLIPPPPGYKVTLHGIWKLFCFWFWFLMLLLLLMMIDSNQVAQEQRPGVAG